MNTIRNFVIIAHIDHGKSTLADRFLEMTGTVPAREMRPQYLDQLDLERERGITIKMAPVRMVYRPFGQGTYDEGLMTNNNRHASSVISHKSSDSEYTLNLIDTPGHSDFSYEVSRALAAVEGAVLLVDVTKGIQAQTLSNFRAAKRAGLAVIGAVNKIDLGAAHAEAVVGSLADLLGVPPRDILRISGKTGEGVKELLRAIVERIPPSRTVNVAKSQALIFDSLYDDHKGILAFVRVFGGHFKAGRDAYLSVGRTKFKIKEVGYFAPKLKPGDVLSEGAFGYIATGLKEPGLVRIGDTISEEHGTPPLPGYRDAAPVVFISFYPDGRTKFKDLHEGFLRLRLNDPALSIEPEANEALGRGLKVGFLGQLHFEITGDRLHREFGLEFLTSFPSIAFRVVEGKKEWIVKQPQDFPDKAEKVFQPMIRLEILTPERYLSPVVNLKTVFDIEFGEIKNMAGNLLVAGRMPLAELIRDFDDRLKSVSAGFASFSYELDVEAPADVVKLEILIAGSIQPALTRVVPAKDVEREGRSSVERLKELLPREQFVQAIQALSRGRIIARETIPALKKDVTGYLYGGDRTRKMKLWKKQQRGKEKLKTMAKVNVPVEVFRELLKK